MRLSEWRAEAPARAAVETKVVAVLEPVLAALGAGKDPHGWAAWGEDFTPGGRQMSNTWQGEFPNENLTTDGYETGIDLDKLAAAVAVAENQVGIPLGGRWMSWYRAQKAREAAKSAAAS